MMASCPDCGTLYRHDPLPARVRGEAECPKCGYTFTVYAEAEGEATATVTMSSDLLSSVSAYGSPPDPSSSPRPERMGDDVIGPLAMMDDEPVEVRRSTVSPRPAPTVRPAHTARPAIGRAPDSSQSMSQTVLAVAPPAASTTPWLVGIAGMVGVILLLLWLLPPRTVEARAQAGRIAVENDLPAEAAVRPEPSGVPEPPNVPEPRGAPDVAGSSGERSSLDAPPGSPEVLPGSSGVADAPAASVRPAPARRPAVDTVPRPMPGPVPRPIPDAAPIAPPPAATVNPPSAAIPSSDLRDPFGDIR